MGKTLRNRILAVVLPVFLAGAADVWPVCGQVNRSYTIKNGLSSSFVNDICQDADGYVWLATDDGLNRFDGEQFRVFRHIPSDSTSLPSSKVNTLFQDSRRNLWVGTMNGLARYDKAGDRFVREIPQIGDNKVSALMEDRSGNLWIGVHSQGIYRYDLETRSVQIIGSASSGLSSDYVNCLFEADNGDIWVGTQRMGLCVYSPGNGRVRHYSRARDGLSGDNVSVIIKDSFSRILAASIDGGVSRYDSARDCFVPLEETGCRTPLSGVYRMTCSRDNVLWLATDGYGVQCIDLVSHRRSVYTGKFDHFLTSSSKIHSLTEDTQGNIWIGVYASGVYLITDTDNNFNYYALNSLFFGKGVTQYASISVLEDSRGYVWVGTDGGGLYRYERHESEGTHLDELSTAAITALYEDREHNVWVGTYKQGANRFNTTTRRFDRVINYDRDRRGKGMEYVTCFAEDPAGRLWMGTGGRGLTVYDPRSGEVSHLSTSDSVRGMPLNNNYILSLRSDGARMWIGSYGGLTSFSFRDSVRMEYNTGNSALINNVVYDIFRDSRGYVWVGTLAGLNRIDSLGRMEYVEDFTKLVGGAVSGIREDFSGRIWFSSRHGLASYEYATESFAVYRNYPELLSGEFLTGCHYLGAHGELYFGGTEGVVSFKPPFTLATVRPLNLVFTTLTCLSEDDTEERNLIYIPRQQDISERNHVVIARGVNTFSVGFRAITYKANERVSYRVRLLGYDSRWEEIAENAGRQVRYSNLPAGTYTLEVMAFIGNDSDPLVRSLAIEVQPSVWRTKFAYGCYFLLIVLFVAALVRVLRRREQRYRQRMQREHDEHLLRYKLDIFTEISHEIRTPLTLVESPLAKLIRECRDNRLLRSYRLMARNIERILSLVNEMIDISKIDNDQYRLLVEPTDLIEFSERMLAHFGEMAEQRGIKLAFTAEKQGQQPVWVDRSTLEKIYFNLISNAIKYSPEKAEVLLSVRFGAQSVEISVTNTGKEIDAQIREKVFTRFLRSTGDPRTSSGLGLYLTKHLVELHHGTIRFESENGRTVFIVTLLLGSEHFHPAEIRPQSSGEIRKPLPVQAVGPEPGDGNPRYRFRTDRKVLIVEDDVEIRKYMAGELSHQYRVLEASNGESGLARIAKEMPDLIISDIMMPGIDGIAFCKNIKNNPVTAHIPVVLLTAKATRQEQIDGMRESGADLYVTKPFDIEFLQMCIHNILNNRSSSVVNRADPAPSGTEEEEPVSAQEKFIARFQQVLEQELSNPDLSIDSLSRALYVSRVHLHRRIKSIYGMSPSDYIREQRLKRAEKLLVANKLSVSEIAYAVGFNTAGSFAVAFKKFYGMTPSKYGEIHQKTDKK